MLRYSNNGLDVSSVGDDYVAQEGEVLSPVKLSIDQLMAAFLDYPAMFNNRAIEQQISDLELTQTNQRVRDFATGKDNGWLANLDSQIAALKSQLV